MIILHSVIIQMRIIHYKEEYDVCKTYKSVFLFECTCFHVLNVKDWGLM